MKQHIISPEANQDLEAIIDYFTTRNIEVLRVVSGYRDLESLFVNSDDD